MKLILSPMEEKNSTGAAFAGLAASIALNVSCWMTVSTMGDLGLDRLPVPLLLMTLLPVLFYFLGRIPRFGRNQVFYVLMTCAAVVLVGFQYFLKAFGAFFSAFRTAVQAQAGSESAKTTGTADSTYIIAVTAVLIVITSSVLADNMKNHKWIVPAFLTGIPTALGLMFGLKPNRYWFAAFLASAVFFALLAQLRKRGEYLKLSSQTLHVTAAFLAFLCILTIVIPSQIGADRSVVDSSIGMTSQPDPNPGNYVPESTTSPQNGDAEKVNRTSKIVLWILIILAAVLAAVILALAAADAIVRHKIGRAEGPASVFLGFRYLYMVLRRFPFRKGKSKSRVAAWNGFLGPDWNVYRTLVYKERYSRSGLTAEERKETAAYVLGTTKKRRLLRSLRKRPVN